MKHSLLFGCGLLTTLFFAACGDDSGSNSVDQDLGSSSSEESLSSADESSSSEAPDPSWPEGARAATLDDLKKNLIVDIHGSSLNLGTGIHQGMFAFWATEKNTASVLVAFSDFKGGKIILNSTTTKNPYAWNAEIPSQKVMKDLREAKADKGDTLSFIVVNDELMYKVNSGKFANVEIEKLTVDPSVVTSAENLDKKVLSCKAAGNDTTFTYSFYTGRYIMERSLGSKVVSWNAGYMDIFRGHAILATKFTSGKDTYTLVKDISSDLSTMTESYTTESMNCSASDFKYSSVDATKLLGEWASFDSKAKINWTLTLDFAKEYELMAGNGKEEYKGGTWDVYGDVLLLYVQNLLDADTRCKNGCVRGIKGTVKDLSEKGFTFNHSDSDTPALPAQWTEPVYED